MVQSNLQFNKYALITGASSGIGREMAYILAEKNYNLILVSRKEIELNKLKIELEDKVSVIIIPMDLSEIDAGNFLFEKVKSLNLNVEFLVNNAGFGLFGKHLNFEFHLVEQMCVLNMISLTTLSTLFGKEMSESGIGYILNVSSTAGYQPIPYFASYAATKSYVKSFSKSLHHELKESGVRVTCLSPGPTKTKFFEVAMVGAKKAFFSGKPTMGANQVAEIGINACLDGRKSVIAGATNIFSVILLKFIPLKLVQFVVKSYVK